VIDDKSQRPGVRRCEPPARRGVHEVWVGEVTYQESMAAGEDAKAEVVVVEIVDVAERPAVDGLGGVGLPDEAGERGQMRSSGCGRSF